jgi:hypothetical protein
MAKMVNTENGWILRDDWSIDDIQSVAECMEITLTKGQCVEVMEALCKGYDTNYGITWEGIESEIESLVAEEA